MRAFVVYPLVIQKFSRGTILKQTENINWQEDRTPLNCILLAQEWLIDIDRCIGCNGWHDMVLFRLFT